MIAIAQSVNLERWQRQFGHPFRRIALPRPWASLGYLTNGAVVDNLIEVENLTIVVLYDEVQDNGQLWVTLAGFSGVRVPWGIQWGGPEQSRFRKNLLFRPRPRGRGRYPDVFNTRLLNLALRLDRQVDRPGRCLQNLPSGSLVLPRLWAGFRRSQLAAIHADGPELLQVGRRDYEGLTLFPLEWVSHHEQRMTAVFADLRSLPRTQVVPIKRLPHDLQGVQGAASFDFYNNRFRTIPHEAPSADTSVLSGVV
jgi:hypothetical protein